MEKKQIQMLMSFYNKAGVEWPFEEKSAYSKEEILLDCENIDGNILTEIEVSPRSTLPDRINKIRGVVTNDELIDA